MTLSAVAAIVDKVIDKNGFPYTMEAVQLLAKDFERKGLELDEIDATTLGEARRHHRNEMLRMLDRSRS